MSVYIRGMEMPKDGHIIVRIYANGDVCEPTECAGVWGKVANTVQLPPHGRLIDADAFEKANAYFWGMDFNNPKYDVCLCDLVNEAPTVIPAEEVQDHD